MCGRFTLQTSGSQLATFFLEGSLDIAFPDIRPRFNIAPSQMIAAVRAGVSATAEYAKLRWGLIPTWAPDPKIGYKMINARGETVVEKPSFRNAFKHRRCLIPADGFYEWVTDSDGKQPVYIYRADQKPFALAGLWERWTRGAEPIESATILTTNANAGIAPLHNRMPIVIQPPDFERWLHTDADEAATELSDLLRPVPDDFFVHHPVSTLVNSPRNESSSCVQPLGASEA